LSDQSYRGAEKALEDNLPRSDVEKIRKTRRAIINVWRPFETVRREPFAICDARTVAEADLRPVTAHLPKGSGNAFKDVSKGTGFETWNVAYNEAHQWYYADNMEPYEALLVKCFDSSTDGRARRAPHSAFIRGSDTGPARRSVEVRCLVWWET